MNDIKRKEFEKEILLNHTKFNPPLTPKQFYLYLKEMKWASKQGEKT